MASESISLRLQRNGHPLRVVLAGVGSRGDVQPMLGLAQEFAMRGHIPHVAAPPNFEGWVTGLGFPFHPLGDDMQVFMAQNRHVFTGNPLNMLRGMRDYISARLPQQFGQLASACTGADAMVFGGLALAAPSVAEHLRLPLLGVAYSSCMLPSRQHPPPTFRWHGLPGWINAALWRGNRVVMDRLARGPLNAARADLGLAPIDSVRHHLLEGVPLVVAADEVLFPADPTWKGRYRFANFIRFDDPTTLDPELEAWLADGEPPVFVGFGSMSAEGTDRIGRLIVEAVCATGRRGLVGAGWAGLGSGTLPSGWRVVREAPHAALFPRTAVVVHHGGAGTMATALRAGVPQVLLPLILDQFHHAHRMHLAGLAPQPVPMERITAAELTDSILAAMALPEVTRRAASERLRVSDGRAAIAQQLEAMLRTP